MLLSLLTLARSMESLFPQRLLIIIHVRRCIARPVYHAPDEQDPLPSKLIELTADEITVLLFYRGLHNMIFFLLGLKVCY